MQSASELAYAHTSVDLGFRSDGRGPCDFRPFELQTGVAPQSNGSAHLKLGGTSVVVGCKLETQNSKENGRIECSVSCLPTALESLEEDPSAALSDYMTTLFAFLASHPQLSIIQRKKSWVVHLDALVLSADGGNLYDALIIAARSALWDLKIPKTRGIGYDNAPNLEEQGAEERDADMVGFSALLKGKKGGKGDEIDFELESYWDEGEHLQDRELLPVSVTLNLVRRSIYPCIHVGNLTQMDQKPFFDANLQEESATPARLLVAINGRSNVCSMRQEGHGEIRTDLIDGLLDTASEVAHQLIDTLNARLGDSAQVMVTD